MKITKVQLYLLFGFSIILTLLQINAFFNLLGLFITCFIISYNCFKDIKTSIKYGIFLVIVLSLVSILLKVSRYTFDKKDIITKENFNMENAKENTDIATKKQNQLNSNKEIQKQNPSGEIPKDTSEKETIEDTESDNNHTKTDTFTNNESNELDKYLDNIDINDTDEKYPDTSIIKDMSPAQAQRELYKLIDTTNLLKQTMTEMTPIINEGKKIMKSIDSLNLLG